MYTFSVGGGLHPIFRRRPSEDHNIWRICRHLDDNDGGDDHGKSDKGPDTENVTDMANKIFETQLADSGKKI